MSRVSLLHAVLNETSERIGNMFRRVCTKSDNDKHSGWHVNTYRHGMYKVSYVHVYTMYRHGMYMFMTLHTNLTIHKHVHTMFRHYSF